LLFRILSSFVLCVYFIFSSGFMCNTDEAFKMLPAITVRGLAYESNHHKEELPEEVSENKKANISKNDIELIALITMAEAEGECEEGKRLVIDTILNRLDSEYFPDTIYEVIYQPGQFSSVWNGRVERCEVRTDICELVEKEAEKRTNSDVIFFTAGCYSNYGKPLFQIGNHCFSSYR